MGGSAVRQVFGTLHDRDKGQAPGSFGGFAALRIALRESAQEHWVKSNKGTENATKPRIFIAPYISSLFA
jgi:hypothetical protein